MYPRLPLAALRRKLIRCLSGAAWMTLAEQRPALSRDGSSPSEGYPLAAAACFINAAPGRSDGINRDATA